MFRKLRLQASSIGLAVLYCLPASSVANDWKSFQNGGRLSFDTSYVPGDVRWSRPLPGYGQSSPLIWRDSIYVTSVVGDQKDECLINCLALSDGKKKWQYALKNATPQENTTYVSRAAPTPVCDVSGVVAFFEGGNVVALDHEGKEVWNRNLVADYGDVSARHGLAASLESNGKRIFVWVERSEAPYVLCLDRASGETLWKVDGVGATSWASPRLIDVQDEQHLVLSAIGSVVGLDPESGSRLWVLDGISGNSTPTPIPLGDGQFLLGATTGRGSPTDSPASKSNGVVQIQKAGNNWLVDFVWRAKRATSSFGSPIVHQDLALFVNREGVLYGLDRATGEERFAQRLKGSVWATPVGFGDCVQFFQKDGRIETMTINDEPRSTVVWDSLPPVDDQGSQQTTGNEVRRGFAGPVMYGVAVGKEMMLLRRGNQLTAVSLSTGKGQE